MDAFLLWDEQEKIFKISRFEVERIFLILSANLSCPLKTNLKNPWKKINKKKQQKYETFFYTFSMMTLNFIMKKEKYKKEFV